MLENKIKDRGPIAANYKQVIDCFNQLPEDIKSWIPHVPKLIEEYSWDIPIAFTFNQIETIKRRTLSLRLIKYHKTNAELTWKLIDEDYMLRERFRVLFDKIFGTPIPDAILAHLTQAEAVRDRAMHGKSFSEKDARICLPLAFTFLQTFSAFVEEKAGFRPCSNAQGIKGAAASLNKETTKWVLKGMGIPEKNAP